MDIKEIGRAPETPRKLKSCLPKHQFSTGFIRFFDMAKYHVRFIYKPNAFWSILGAILRFWHQNHQMGAQISTKMHQNGTKMTQKATSLGKSRQVGGNQQS